MRRARTAARDFCRLVARFGRARRGAVAVEFALVAVPFIAMLFAILQTALVFFAQQVFETAVSEAGRLIMTGQTAGYDAAAFKTQVCSHLLGLISSAKCQANVAIDVRSATTFAGAVPSAPVKKVNGVNTLDVSGFGFQTTASGAIVTVRAVYQWPIFMSLLDPGLANIGQSHLLVATTVFRNEPFAPGS